MRARWRMALKRFLICCCFILTAPYGFALELDTQQPVVNPVNRIQVLADPSGSLGLDEIQSPALASQFVAATPSGADINLGFTQGVYWLKLSLSRQHAAQSDWILSVPFQSLDELTLYAPGKTPIATGNLAPFSTRPIVNPFFAFPITVETSPQDFYLKVSSQYAVTVPIEIMTPKVFNSTTQNTAFVQALYYGELLGLVLYNLLLFFYLRERSFVLYALFGIALGLGIFAGNGYGRMYLWQDQPYWDEVAQSACLSLAAMFGILFTNNFLKVRRISLILHKILVGMALALGTLSLGMALAQVLAMPTRHLFMAFLILAPLTTLLLITAGIMALKAGQREARFFLLAWGILWSGAMIAALRAFGLAPTNAWTSSATQISSSFEMLLLSFALADRMRLDRQARERAQLETLAAEESLRAERKLRELYTRFGAYVSHEFRTPLSLIESQVSLFQREREKKIDRGDERLSSIEHATSHLSDLFDRWLQTDRLGQALSQSQPEQINLNDWLPPFIKTIQRLQTAHTIELQPMTAPVMLHADVRLLKTALLNLVDNACKYSDLDRSVSIRVVEEPQCTGIEVTDYGVGIDEEHQQKIFDAYFRCDTESPIRGIGLGLSFVKQIMDLHRGKITLSSNPGSGSVFCLWFPNQAPEATARSTGH